MSVARIRPLLAWLPALVLAMTLVVTVAASESAALAESHQVDIDDFTFRPETLSIAVGDTVTWTNRDILGHTATAADLSFDSPHYLLQEQSYAFTFLRPGIYTYFCIPHEYMRGTIIVRAEQFTFPETGFTVRGRFLAYWIEHGGLSINGLPISDEFEEILEDGRRYTVQYFERVRLEHHPENQPPYDVLLGQFGRHIHPSTQSAQPIPGAVYFTETGHNLDRRFLAYWRSNGGLAQFGYPISEEFEAVLEDGKQYRVQYFERARFEHHPENAYPYDVLLGQFGRHILSSR